MARHVKRWALITWAVLVAAGGAATVWLQSGEPEPGPAGQRPGVIGPEAEPSPAVISGDTAGCPEPSPSPSAGVGDPVFVACLEAEGVQPPEEEPAAEYDYAPDPSPDLDPPTPGEELHCPSDEPDDHVDVLCIRTREQDLRS